MKTQLITALSFTAAIGMVQAVTIASDNFDSFAANADIGGSSDWNAKWDGGDPTQQSLYRADGAGTVNLDTTVAKINYNALHQTGFVVGGAGYSSVTIAFDFNYSHNGGGAPFSANESFFGPSVSDQPQWWNSTIGDETLSIANRGGGGTGAIGNRVNGAPFIEGWISHGSLGVDPTVAGSTSSNINVAWTLTDNGTTIDAQGTITHGGGSYNTTSWDTGYASGTTLYGGFSTGWNQHTGVGGAIEDQEIDDVTNIENVNIDNFIITGVPIPEPSSILLAGLAGLGIFRRRR